MRESEFEQLVEQYQRLVYTICFQMTRDRDTAEDLVQETFLSAYLHRDRCNPENIRPWLCRIATNKAKDLLKSAYHRKVALADEDQELALMGETSPPEDLVIDSAMKDQIAQQIRALHEPYLQVSVLYFLEQMPVEEIAARLGRPVKTVHTQLYRAKRILQQQLLKGGIIHDSV